MERFEVTEVPRKMESVDRDTFIDDLGELATQQEVEIKEENEQEQTIHD